MSSRFNGAGNHLGRALGVVLGSSDFTVVFWARLASTPAGADYVTLWETSDGAGSYAGVYTNASDADKFYVEVSDNITFPATTGLAFESGVYLPFAYVRTGNDHKFYSKTGLIGTTTLDVSAAVFANTHLGSGTAAINQDTFNAREWSAALTFEEILAEWKSATVIRTANLNTDTPLLTNGDDISGNNFDYNDVGTVTWLGTPTQRNLVPITATSITLPHTGVYDPNNSDDTETFDMWFSTLVGAAIDALLAWSYDFSTSYNPATYAYDDAFANIFTPTGGADKPVQFIVPEGELVYIRSAKSGNVAGAVLNLKVENAPELNVIAGQIFVNNDQPGFPATIASHLADYTTIDIIPDIAAGEQGDILDNGIFLLEELPDALPDYYIKLYEAAPSYALITSINSATGTAIRTCRGTQRFWWGKDPGSTNPIEARSVSDDGTLGPAFTLTGTTSIEAIAANNDETILYFNARGTGQAIKRWDLVNNIALANFVAGITNYRAADILVLTGGNILILWYNTAAPYDAFARLYDTTGLQLNEYPFGSYGLTNRSPPRMFFSLDEPISFMVFLHEEVNATDTQAIALFLQVRVSDGAILNGSGSGIRHAEYNDGTYGPTATASPLARSGVPNSCPAFLMQSSEVTTTGIGIVTPGTRTDLGLKMPRPFFKTFYGGR